jgi:hypothetical protein
LEDAQVAKEMRETRTENASQSAKTDGEALLLKQKEERRFQDALEDDEVREALKILHARDEERMRKKQEETGLQSAKTNREALLEQKEERQFQDALEDDDVREVLKSCMRATNSA